MSNDMPVVQRSASVARDMLTKNKVQQTPGGDLGFLKFDSKRTGEWLFGQAGESVQDEIFALDLESLKHGWVLWHNKKPNRRMVAINQDLPDPQDPIRYTDAKGKDQVDEANEARSIEGWFDDGTKFQLEVSTYGGRKAIDGLFAQLFQRANAGSEFIFPQVKLESSSYDHTQYGLVYTPELEPVAWFDDQGNAEPTAAPKLEAVADPEPAEEPAEDPAPARRRRKK